MQQMDEVYRRYANTVYKYLMSVTGDPDLAEELTQETFYQAVRSAHRFRGESNVSTWLCSIAKNCLAAYRRKHPPTEEYTEENLAGDSGSAAEDSILSGLARVELMRKVHALPEKYRETIYLRVFGNMSFKEIADVLGISENAARVNYYRGKEKLRKDVETDG